MNVVDGGLVETKPLNESTTPLNDSTTPLNDSTTPAHHMAQEKSVIVPGPGEIEELVRVNRRKLEELILGVCVWGGGTVCAYILYVHKYV